MSQGGNGPAPDPGPIGPVPAPVVVTKTWEDRLWNLLPIAFMILLMVAVNRGWLKPEQADAINKMIPLVVSASPPSNDDGNPSVEVSSGKNAAGANTLIVKSTPAVAPQFPAVAPQFTVDDLDKWLPFIEKVGPIIRGILNPPGPTPIDPDKELRDEIARLHDQINRFLNPPAPTPIDNNKPTPIDPKPVPVDPTPGVSKILITDELGKSIAAATVEAGVLFQVSSNVAAGAAGWAPPTRSGDVKCVTLANSAGFVCYLQPGAWIEFHLTDFASRQQLVSRITCNQGAQPPPLPGPTPMPVPDVKPVQTQSVGLYVVWDFADLTPETSILMKDTKFWMSIQSRGNVCRMYLSTTADPTGKWAIEQISKKGQALPAMVIVDQNRLLLDVVALPENAAGVESLIQKFGGK